MKKSLLLLGLLIITLNIYAQTTKVTIYREINKEVMQKRIDSLKKNFGNYKFFPKELELQTLIALSYFPELRKTFIDFKTENISTTMACRPDIRSVLSSKGNRTYNIFIDNDSHDTGNILLKDVPFNAQIGVIAHELCHILDYERMTSAELAELGIDYSNEIKKSIVEKRVDKITIKKGLGWQLYDWADFVLNKSKASSEYKEFKRKTYLTPEQIKQEISKDRQYNFAYSKGFWRNDFMIEVWGVCLGIFLSFVFQSDFRTLVLKHLQSHD